MWKGKPLNTLLADELKEVVKFGTEPWATHAKQLLALTDGLVKPTLPGLTTKSEFLALSENKAEKKIALFGALYSAGVSKIKSWFKKKPKTPSSFWVPEKNGDHDQKEPEEIKSSSKPAPGKPLVLDKPGVFGVELSLYVAMAKVLGCKIEDIEVEKNLVEQTYTFVNPNTYPVVCYTVTYEFVQGWKDGKIDAGALPIPDGIGEAVKENHDLGYFTEFPQVVGKKPNPILPAVGEQGPEMVLPHSQFTKHGIKHSKLTILPKNTAPLVSPDGDPKKSILIKGLWTE